MRRILTLLFFVFVLSNTLFSQQMTDEQVIQYVKSAQMQGKTQKQMSSELMRKGVTKEQVLRIKDKIEGKNVAATEQDDSRLVETYRRKTEENVEENAERVTEKEQVSAKIQEVSKERNRIFGHNLFRARNLTFEPSANLATPENYKLGPGDEVIIYIWGTSENTIRRVISPEGHIQVSTIGAG